jgi:hypothetical protein
MADTSCTNRQYAYLRLTSETEDPAAVTAALGLEPDQSWAAGNSFGRGERTMRRKFSSWKLWSGVPDTAYLGDHVDALLLRIVPTPMPLLRWGPAGVCRSCASAIRSNARGWR